MCDYSLENVKSRKAEVGDKIVSHKFAGHTTGFASPADRETAVCMLPGTELAFDAPIRVRMVVTPPGDQSVYSYGYVYGSYEEVTLDATVAMFMQFPKHEYHNTWRDGFELVTGEKFKLNQLLEGQTMHVLQVPAEGIDELPGQSVMDHIELPADCEPVEQSAAEFVG